MEEREKTKNKDILSQPWSFDFTASHACLTVIHNLGDVEIQVQQ